MQDTLAFIFGIPLTVYAEYGHGLHQFFRAGLALAVGYFVLTSMLLAFLIFRISRRPRTFRRIFLQCWLVALAFLPGAAFYGGFQVAPLALVLVYSLISAQFATILGNTGFILAATLAAWLAAITIHLLFRPRHVV